VRFFSSDTNILRRSSPARAHRRFICRVIDLLLVALVAEGIFGGAFFIASNTETYKNAENTINREIAYYESLIADTHVVEYVDGERVSTDVVVLKNLYRAICLSYEVFGNNQQPSFSFDESHDVMMNGSHTPQNDNVAYFYTYYLEENPHVGVGVNRDIFEIYKKAFGSDAAFMFSFNREISDMPVLNTQVAYYLFHYFFIDSQDSIGQTGATYYDAYHTAYSNMLEEAEMLIIESEPYNSTHYASYKEAYCAEARYTNIALVLSILIAYLAVMLTARYLFKDGRGVGYKLFGLGAVSTDGEAVKPQITLLKTIVESVGVIPIAFILYLFPPFNGGYEAMFMPVTSDGRLSFAMVILFIMAVYGINNAIGLFTQKKQSLLNMIFGEVIVDSHYPDEGDEPINHGREY
jgi:hypothetical protein